MKYKNILMGTLISKKLTFTLKSFLSNQITPPPSPLPKCHNHSKRMEGLVAQGITSQIIYIKKEQISKRAKQPLAEASK